MGYHHFVLSERSQIQSLSKMGCSIRSISSILDRSPSTVSRELKRNQMGTPYDGDQAHRLARDRRSLASRKANKMSQHLIHQLHVCLEQKWSPEQISGYWKRKGIFISHSTIYQYVWGNRMEGGCLYQHLRHRGKRYKYRGQSLSGRGKIPHRIDIRLRPKIVHRKSRIGDWEADTIMGKAHQGVIVSSARRKTKFTKLMKVNDKTANSVTEAIISSLQSLPIKHQTITFDNGKEFASHQLIAKQTGVKTYFATPYHSWERGLNEHTNGLVRQYLPKSTNLHLVDQQTIKRIENDLNNRPRKVLDFRSPNEVMQIHLRRRGVALDG